MPDEALLDRIAARDVHALADLVDRHAPAALALAGRILGDRSEAAELLQAVFAQVWQEAGRYNPAVCSAAAWILSRVRHGALDRLRRRAAGAGPVRDASKPSGAMAGLPPDQRQVLELAYFEGLSQTQIAQKLGEPLNTVKTRVKLGMNRLKQALPGESP